MSREIKNVTSHAGICDFNVTAIAFTYSAGQGKQTLVLLKLWILGEDGYQLSTRFLVFFYTSLGRL